MLPRWHVLLGAIFSILLWLIFPQIGIVNALLVFLASFLIDFDHYLNAVRETGSLSLFGSFRYYTWRGKMINKQRAAGIKKKDLLQPFHTLEFHLLVLILGFIWAPLFYILLGMFFHSLTDLIWLIKEDALYMREYFFISWLLQSKS